MWQKLLKNWKPWAIGLGSAVLLVLVFSFVPIMRVSYLAEEMYPAVETYYVRESYTVEEPYTVLEPCEEYIPIDYSVISGHGYNYIESDGQPACTVELYIKNTDVEDGTFSVEFLLTLHHNLTTTVTGEKHIEAGVTGRVVASYYDAPLETPYSFSYAVTASTKLNPTYREEEVIEYNEVTEYTYAPEEVTVLKTGTVTVYKRVSLLDYLVNY